MKNIQVEVIILTICLLCLAFVFQGTRAIWQPDEGYYVGTTVTMIEKGSLTIPYLGEDEIFLDKPPLIYLGIIGGLKLFGHNEFAVRFFHGLSFVLTAAMVGLLAYSMFGTKKIGFLSCLIYATMVIPFIAANFVTPDTLLSLWTTAAAFSFWQSAKPNAKRILLWKLLLCLFVGLGFLAKGPAVLIPCGGMFVFLVLRKKAFRYFINPFSIVGLMVFCIVGFGWYFLVSLKIPGSLSYFFDSQIWGRLFSGKYHRNAGLTGALIYLPILIFGSLPWSHIWLEKRKALFADIFKRYWWINKYNDPQILFLMSLFFVPLIILCLAQSKLGLYALPLFAPFAIATARFWHAKIGDIESGHVITNLKRYGRFLLLTGTWISLLIVSKLALAYYPTNLDMRALSEEIAKVVGKDNYELGTVDERADGLIFYGIREVEHLTKEDDPYPTYTKTEHVSAEVEVMTRKKERGIFLVHGANEIDETCQLLSKANVKYQMINLSHQRVLLILQLHL
ncbi:MAG: glycosyltransferase family 39 protein [Phycisphaerae bacterium]|nr:glycosyltransferase family 39 protein [Phycisphaerae bacterium]